MILNKKKMNLKRKKKFKLKYIILIVIIYLTFSYTFYYSVKKNYKSSNKEFINYLVNGGNINTFYDKSLTQIVNSTVKYTLNIDFSNPTTLLNHSILSLGKKEEENIVLEHIDDYSNMEELKDVSSYIEDPNPTEISNPLIYIYNTHQLENYDNTNLEIYGITPNVLMASYILKEKLNKLGIPSIVEDTNMTDFLTINGWSSSDSYKASRILMLEKKTKYDSLTYFIDIHRDSITKENSTATINSKKYAKILFVVGLEHDNYSKNLKVMEDLNNLFNEYYPGLSRGLYKKEGPLVDGIYNQDISPNTILIEVGGYQNNIEEVFNTIEAISDILYKYIEGD